MSGARITRSLGRVLRGLGCMLLVVGFHVAPVHADEKKELEELRQRLDKMKRELAASEGTRAEAADQLRDSERAISEANRKLREINGNQVQARKSLREIEANIRRLEGDLGGRSRDLSRFLAARYMAGSDDASRLLLSGDDPHRIARDLYYLGYVSRAQTDIIRGLRSTVEAQQALAEEARAKTAELAKLEREEREEQRKLERERAERRTLLVKISEQIKTQQRQIQTAQQNEQRLAQLVERLTRMLQERAERERKERERAARPGKGSPPAVRNDKVPESAEIGGVFSTLKGRMRLPIRGELTSRFGAPRPDGGPSWKGVFIKGAPGDEVRAVGPGRVVFADWMRGFGNLLIVDHGQGYLTIYGNNESLLKQPGDAVKSGDAIATVGASGGSEQQGLYFELRHQGRALDPLSWVGR